MILERPLLLGSVNHSEVIYTRPSPSTFARTKTVRDDKGNTHPNEQTDDPYGKCRRQRFHVRINSAHSVQLLGGGNAWPGIEHVGKLLMAPSVYVPPEGHFGNASPGRRR